MAAWQVRIEFLRVQTFLFAVPRLLDILGANTLLGETLRQGLYRLAVGDPPAPFPYPPGIRLPPLPGASLDDPLTKCVGLPSADLDNPQALYAQGMLARDGGHFQALFADETKANAFRDAAASLVLRTLPGLRFDVSVRPIPPPADKQPLQARSVPLLALPGLQVCEESGRGIASDVFRSSDIDRYVSQAVLERKERGGAFRGQAATGDIASLLADQLPHKKPPKTFEELCAGRYLALIHADGNGIGDWSNRVRGEGRLQDLPSFINQEALGEAFYHAMRVAVRKAVVAALNDVFKPEEFDKHDPYRLLMLGGDDLLLVCRAEFALPFVRAYAQALDEIKTLPDCEPGKTEPVRKPLTVGVGVAIAKPSLPFHRLHQIAEALASSAKRLARGGSLHASVVDWTICTEAWMDDVEEARQADVIRHVGGDGNETLVLSHKPYFILDSAAPPGQPTLESLLKAYEALENMPRSQRRALASELRRGRCHAELCVEELRLTAPEAWKELKKAGWVDDEDKPALWNGHGGGCYATTYADAVELAEIRHLKLGDTEGQ